MAQYKTLLALASIAIALLAPLCVALKARSDIRTYPIIKVDVEPYDPRDLLYGHYMQFRIKWNWKPKKIPANACQGEDCCLCVGAGSENPPVALAACEDIEGQTPRQCTHVLQGTHYGWGNGDNVFDININRYYVDEAVALPLEQLFRNKKEAFQVGLSISPSGKPLLEKLYVGGKAVEDYFRAKGSALYMPVDPVSP